MKRLLRFVTLAWVVMLLLMVPACEVESPADGIDEHPLYINKIVQDGNYFEKEDVAIYLHMFSKLPPNYMTKAEAERVGWIPREGNLWEVADGAVIGGDRFGNRERLLPEEQGRQYYECDVNYYGGYRGPERLVYSNDGLIYYSEDHYETFVQMMFEEGVGE
jgi:hypothetical protein